MHIVLTVCVFFLFNNTNMYTVLINLNVFVCTNEFIVFFLPLHSVLVIDILRILGEWGLDLNIFPINKHSNSENADGYHSQHDLE